MAEPRVGVGLIVPFDFALDDEYWRYAPQGVVLHITRTPHVAGLTGAALAATVADDEVVGQATRALVAVGPAVVAYACTAGSFAAGLAGEARLRRCMQQAGATVAVTTIGALLRALDSLTARRIAVATPYGLELTERLVAFLRAAGREVTSVERLDLDDGIWRIPPATVADLVVAANRPDADAVFVSCTNLPTLGIHAELETLVGKPVLTANQVTMWAALWDSGRPPEELPQALLRTPRLTPTIR